MATLHLNLYAHLGCLRNIPKYARASVSVRCKETEDIRALDWCPRPVVFPLQFYRFISYSQHQLILQIWNILHNDFFLVPEMSSMNLN